MTKDNGLTTIGPIPNFSNQIDLPMEIDTYPFGMKAVVTPLEKKEIDYIYDLLEREESFSGETNYDLLKKFREIQ